MITLLEEKITMQMDGFEARALERALGKMCRAAWRTAQVSEDDINTLDNIYAALREHFDPPFEAPNPPHNQGNGE